ncbi:MAG: hypothetical protein EOO15_05025 [Chitinophagaceae bacterium]|nr:MAG: hypothetical protein EOO15_05025 [Chitinophagaceae bacterium]
MSFIDRMSLGWRIAMNSFRVLRANKQLIIFPILSGASLLLVLGSFLGIFFAFSGFDEIDPDNVFVNYGTLFFFYLINYFIITFFNMALVHCTRLYFEGEEASVRAGIRFSVSRLRFILAWSLLAATVGTALRIIQENVGIVGKIITAVVGVVWSVATFFVVPVIAYENLGPIDAVKRSAQLMRQKWGESLGSRFSFGIVNILAFLLIVVPLFFLGLSIHVVLGVALAVTGLLLVSAIISAAQTIFVSSVYQNVTGSTREHFDQRLVDQLFVSK